MKFVIVNPKPRTVETVEFPELRDAIKAAGLDPGAVDHGTISRGLAYVVFEYGLFVPPAEQSYFCISGHLIAGPAVLYGFDEAGETVDAVKSTVPDVKFYLGVNDVEAAIDRAEVVRPAISVNGDAIWAWPSATPPGMELPNKGRVV